MEGDDTWHIKCTSALTSPPQIPPPPPPPPPSSSPAPPLPPPLPPSLNQMDTNSRQYFGPFMAPRTNLENRGLVQEPFVFQTLNLDFAKSGKTELGNSFVALLSGHPHNLLSEFSQVPNSRPTLAKVQAPIGGGIVRGASSNVSFTSVVPLPENSTSGFVESRPSLVSTSYQTATSKQAFQGTNEGMATSSVSCNRSTNNSFQNVGQHHPLSTQTSHRMPRESSSSVPVHDSTRSRGRPHVMCMITVGELFLSELGLLGVICFCHNLRMSVANFCKHSGSSANPGEAVRLVNGMTLARWRKQCFGSNAPDDFKGWDWSGGPSAKTGLIGSGGSTFPILPQNPGTICSAPTFVGLGKPGDPRNKTLYPKSPYISFGQAPIKHLTNKDANNMNQRNSRLEGPNHSSKSFTIASQSHMPAIAKNQTVNVVNETPDNHNRKGKFGNSTFLYSYSDAQKSFPREYNSSRDGFTSDAFVVAREGSSSNIDLRLGQPSQAHASIGSLSTAMNPLHFAACKTQKSQVNLPLKEKTDHPMEPKKARINLGCNAFKSPSENTVLAQHAVGSSNTSSNSGLEGFAGNPTKNSLISLFLSHLNNEGSSSSQITNTVNKSKHSLLDSTSTKCNISEHASDINGGHERRIFIDGSDLSNNMDKAKQLRSFDNRRFSFHFDEPPRTLQTGPDSRIPTQYGIAPSIGNRGNCNHANNSSMIPFSCANSTLGLPKSGAPMNNRSNSVYISEPTGPSHSKSIDHSQHLMDENMRFLALRHMARQERSPSSLQVGHIHKRLCCHLAGMEDLKQESCYGIQQNPSHFNGRSEQTCHNCYSGNGVGNLVAKLGKRDRNEYCKCAALAQRSKEQDIPTCHVCGADEHPCLRLRGIPNYSSGSVKPIFDQKEQTTPFYKRCCCSVLPNHLTQCCSSRDYSPSHSLNKQSICGVTRTTHITQACDDDHTLQDRRSICSCECPKKQFFFKNDCQTGLWRDVPAKKIENTVATLIDKPSHLQKFPNRTEKESESMNEQQMSNVCSASSAPAITEVSIEVNKVDYCAMNIVDNKTAYDFVSDEGSVVEKCGSTDGETGIRECEKTLAANGMVVLPSHSPDNRNDELRMDSSSNKEKISNQLNVQSAVQDNVEEMKMNSDMLVPKSGFNAINSESSQCVNHLSSEASSPNGSKALSQPGAVVQKSIVKRKRSSLSSIEPISLKKDNHHNIPNNILIPDNIPAVNDDQSLRAPEISFENNAASVHREKQSATNSKQEGNHLDSDKPPRYMSLCCTGKSDNHGKKTVDKKARPVVSGKSGIISIGGVSGQRKPAKMVSLSLILKRTKRCDITEDGTKSKIIPDASNECYDELSSSKLQSENEDSSAYKRKRRDPATVLVSGKNKECFSGSDSPADEFSMIENETDGGSDREEELALHHKYRNCQTKPRYREVHICSLSKLLEMDKNSTKLSYASTLGASSSSDINRTENQTKPSPSTATGDSFVDIGLGRNSLDDDDCVGGLDQTITGRSRKVQKHQTFPLNSDASCCVCGSSNKEHINCILECKSCLIKVHQACYGASKVPKGHWYCRPCKTNSQNTVCVLCGYEGGAMTRAVKSQNIVKSLLKNWKFGTDSCFMKLPPSELVKCEASKVDKSCSGTALRSVSSDAFPEGTVDLTSQNQISFARHLDSFPKELQMNSIIAGVLDPSAIQWVHMVCGLWTPGTRCPNVDTMSAFDVSGASAARKSTVCSLCNRPGGCCIRCRVLKCSVHFHPWCAHQKGLLQSEIEGDNNDKVGFYGSCMLHAAQNGNNIDSHPIDAEVESPQKDQTCARTESFKGRKSDKGFKPNKRKPPYSDSGGCIVSQEQINAWLHINGQKSCARAVVKLPSSDVEYDCRKEYFRYKQSEAWKHLVVYKSGIHALGLYTSQFIMRGAMVVEYVGEIVGLRVADKREIEYQTGRRLQYKSACYFFRINKEHIIDATRKGGIARFVNHSCMPNCVAKVISVRNEKKVVFFAERDINPGEEITYDYHFNSEDEGQKIPCYCNTKNCRQYLN